MATSSRNGVHLLSNGLMVSGQPEIHPAKRQLSINSRAVPYTGGDVRKSGEIGKMLGINPNAPPMRPGSKPYSGPRTASGPLGRKTSSSTLSGPINSIPATGLITSGPLESTRRNSGALEGLGIGRRSFKKVHYGSGVTNLGSGGVRMEWRLPSFVMWVFLVVAMMGLVVGTFLYAAVNRPVLLIVVITILVPGMLGLVWNVVARRWGVMRFMKGYKDCELRKAEDGDFVKITGVVTCGGLPVETTFQKVPRCVYASTELYEYRGVGSKPVNANHRLFSWGCSHSENYVADFYISDLNSGLRVLVKAGYGAKVAPFAKSTTVVDFIKDETKDDQEKSANFQSWLSERGLSTDDRIMRLKETYIKEGTEASVMGVVSRNENVLMIIPPEELISTGFSWLRCLFPTYIDGLIVSSEHMRAKTLEASVPV